MMLQLVSRREEKVAAQKLLTALVRKCWRHVEKRRIVWRPDGIDLEIASDGMLWFATHKAGGDGATLRYWNSFGEYTKSGNLNIAIEINIPIDSNDRRVSGFFAKDPMSGVVYLMHDGGVGGGRKGVGRDAFLGWSGLRPVPVEVPGESARFGLIVASLVEDAFDAALSSFVARAMGFKIAVRTGEIVASDGAAEGYGFADYFREFSGKKAGERRAEFEYVSRHGDIVDALATWANRPAGRVVKNAWIDLGIEVAGRLTHLFEVKTNVDRQCLYTGIGQLLVHSSSYPDVERFLVVPAGNPIAGDISSSLRTLRIQVIRFDLRGRNVTIRGAS